MFAVVLGYGEVKLFLCWDRASEEVMALDAGAHRLRVILEEVRGESFIPSMVCGWYSRFSDFGYRNVVLCGCDGFALGLVIFSCRFETGFGLVDARDGIADCVSIL